MRHQRTQLIRRKLRQWLNEARGNSHGFADVARINIFALRKELNSRIRKEGRK